MPRRPTNATRIRGRMLLSWIFRCQAVAASMQSSISVSWTLTRVLVFTMHSGAAYALQAFRAGAKGYVTKSSPPDLLVDAVKAVSDGRLAISPEIAQVLA